MPLDLQEKSGPEKVRRRMKEGDGGAHGAVQEARFQDIAAEKLEERPKCERRRTATHSPLETVVRAESRVVRRLPQGVGDIAIRMMDERVREASHGTVHHEDFVNAPAEGAQAPRPPPEAQLQVRVPRAV